MNPLSKYSGKTAFTMAEVLITLGIIGIVAAMTLPALINSYNNKVTETRLKKFYSVFNQAILRSIEANGPYEGWEYWVDEVDEDGNPLPNQPKIRNAFERYLRPYMNVVQVTEDTCRSQVSDGGKCIYYYLADGSVFTFSEHINRTVWYYPKGNWETCEKSGQKLGGRCCFAFTFQPLSSNTSAWKYHINKGLEPFLYEWDGKEETLLNHPIYECANKGTYCTAMIQLNGWRVPKNYPKKIKY